MILSEENKKRFQKLAGIISEATDAERNDAFAASDKRIPFSQDLMATAIKEGREVGVLFQTNNDKHKMPVAKYRIIYPVAMGLSKKGHLVIRAFHKYGQSESKAQATGVRSAEAQNTWRLLKASNIKGMWFTGNFFRGPIEKYNKNDKGMVTVNIAADFSNIRKFQDELFKKKRQEKLAQQKQVADNFKRTNERPLETPIENPNPDDAKLQGKPEKNVKNLFKQNPPK